jgi:hypothetical protein
MPRSRKRRSGSSFSATQGEEADFQTGLQRHRQKAQRCLLAGGIAVKEALDLRVVAAQQHQLAVGDRCSLRGDGGLEPHAPGAQGVELALDHHEGLALADLRAGPVQIEEEITLGEDGRFRRVHVLGLARGVVGGREIRLARRERDHPALMIAYRDHQSPPEARLERAERED